MVVTKLSMVSFFKTPAPVRYAERQITSWKRTEEPFASDSTNVNLLNDSESGGEEVRCVEYGKVPLKEGGSGYLFSAEIEVRRVKSTRSCDGVLRDGLEIVIRKYTGEWVGTIVYDYVYCGREKCFDLSNSKLIKTVHHLEDEKYHVYVNYEGDTKIALRMELCPGDEEVLQKCLDEYEADVVFTPCKL